MDADRVELEQALVLAIDAPVRCYVHDPPSPHLDFVDLLYGPGRSLSRAVHDLLERPHTTWVSGDVGRGEELVLASLDRRGPEVRARFERGRLAAFAVVDTYRLAPRRGLPVGGWRVSRQDVWFDLDGVPVRDRETSAAGFRPSAARRRVEALPGPVQQIVWTACASP